MKISEIMEATPGNGPASASQTKPPPAARPATTAPKSGVDFTPSDVQGGRGSITSKSTSDAGVKTASSQVTGQTRTSDATGTATTNRSNQTIQKQTPRVAGVQQTTNIDPASGDMSSASANPNQATVTRKVPGQTPQQATVPTSQLTGQPGKPR